MKIKTTTHLFAVAVLAFLTGCEHIENKPYYSDDDHLVNTAPPETVEPYNTVVDTSGIPSIVAEPYLPAPAKRQRKEETYTIVVTGVPVKELLFALARDAKLNIDVNNNVDGTVTINAINQPLTKILDRISQQTNIRYAINDGLLSVAADTPYLATYKVPYINMERESLGDVNATVQVGGGASGQSSNASSNFTIKNSAKNKFWTDLESNISAFINAEKENSDVIANPSTGFLTVRATQKQHTNIKKYISRVVGSAQRQVLIEATIVEVTLNNNYEQGINWTKLARATKSGLSLTNSFTPSSLSSSNEQLVVSYLDRGKTEDLSTTIRLLQSFGNVKVLSSPKIMALNNQMSVLKVVDNRVYFRVGVNEETVDKVKSVNYETEIRTVPEGFIMSLLPFIGDDDEVILNVRPTITRVLRYVNDPNPRLAQANVTSSVPEMQVREMETVLRLQSGQVAILGGLMQDTASLNTSQIPGVGSTRGLGNLFKGKKKAFKKSELVVFLRPVRVNRPSIDTDLSDYRQYLDPTMPISAEGRY